MTNFAIKRVFIENPYVASLFPKLKIQKPGYDFYSPIILVQLLICTYIVLFYNNMDATGQNILKQINSS